MAMQRPSAQSQTVAKTNGTFEANRPEFDPRSTGRRSCVGKERASAKGGVRGVAAAWMFSKETARNGI